MRAVDRPVYSSHRMKHGDDTAERILAAADELFGERGFAAVSARDIAARAGVNKALVFYHHDSKAKLFQRVLDAYYRRHTEALERGARHRGTRRQRLHHMLDSYLDFLEENQRYVQLIQRELAGGSAATRSIQKGIAALQEAVSALLGDLLPASGPLAPRQFFLDFSGLAIGYYLYAPALRSVFGEDPLRPTPRRERREHLHWMLDTVMDRLEPVRKAASRRTSRARRP